MRLTLCIALCGAIGFGCAGTPTGAKIDDQIIAGKLSKEGAVYLNETDSAWHKGKRHSGYTAKIEAGDRVLSADASEALIALAEGNFGEFVDAWERIKENDD